MMKVCIEPHCFPSLEFFCSIMNSGQLVLEADEHFVKQTYRNRYAIQTAQGVELLVVPLTAKHGKVPLREVQIDYAQKWQNNHWRTIESAYRKAPFFEHYAPDVHQLIYQSHRFLIDFTVPALSFCLKSLRWDKQVLLTSGYEKVRQGEIDCRNQISAKSPCINRPFYQAMPYYQVFGNIFAANLSILDLLFCTGPQASTWLRQSAKEA